MIKCQSKYESFLLLLWWLQLNSGREGRGGEYISIYNSYIWVLRDFQFYILHWPVNDYVAQVGNELMAILLTQHLEYFRYEPPCWAPFFCCSCLFYLWVFCLIFSYWTPKTNLSCVYFQSYRFKFTVFLLFKRKTEKNDWGNKNI